MRGADGGDLVIPVPVGTVVYRKYDDGATEELADLARCRLVRVARGGRGGRGNVSFVSPVNREPLLAEAGEPGEDVQLSLELKLVADVGIVGLPNSGKSTLISACSAARPKIAPYPFTTLDPVLGVAQVGDRTLVVMEVPGLIEGAHKGVGLGHQFLRHAERASLLWHLVDGTEEDPLEDFEKVNRELDSFGPVLSQKKQVLVINKVDVPGVNEATRRARASLEQIGYRVFVISAATGEGVEDLLKASLAMIAQPSGDTLPEELHEALPRPGAMVRGTGKEKQVVREGITFVIKEPRLERIAALVNLRDRRAVDQLWTEVVRSGVDKALEAEGVKPGDTVRLGRAEMEWK